MMQQQGPEGQNLPRHLLLCAGSLVAIGLALRRWKLHREARSAGNAGDVELRGILLRVLQSLRQPSGTSKGLLHDIHLGTSAAAQRTGPVYACVAVTLDIAYRVIKGQQAYQKAIRLLAEACVELMYLILSADHAAGTCTASAMKEFAEGRLRSDMTDIQEIVTKVTQAGDQASYNRLLVLDGVQQRLEHYKGTFQRAASMLQLDVGPCAFVTAACQAREGIKQDVRHLLLAHPECRGVEDLARHEQGSRELTGIVGALDDSVLKALGMVLDQGSYALLKNKSIRQLWMRHFPDSEQIPWDLFWRVFPSSLEEDKEELEAFFKDKRRRKTLQSAAALTDRDAVDIVELNSIFSDNSSLVEQVKNKIAEYDKNHGAVNQASQALVRIPPDLTRPELGRLVELLQQKRLVVLQGAPGEGKYITACQAGSAMLRPSSTQDQPSSGKHFQAIYCCDMATGKSRDEIDSRLRASFESLPRSGPREDQLFSALSSIIEKDTDWRPYKALLILNNVEEVPDGAVLNDFCMRLHSILFRSTSSGLHPTNFTVIMSSRTEQSRITDWSEAFASESADFRLSALPPDVAGKLFMAEMERCGNAQKVAVSPRDAHKLAMNHCCNPTLLKVLASSIETPAHLKVALRAPLRQAMNRMEAFWDILRACFGRLSRGALSTLLLLVEVTPSAFTHESLVKVLAGWYGATEEDELECAAHGDIKELHAHNFIQLGEGGVYNVVPVIQDCVKHFISHPPDQLWQSHIDRVISALPLIHKNYIGRAVEMLETSFQTSIHTYRAAYVEKTANKQFIQNALILATGDRIEQTPEVVNKVLGLLSLMVYDTLLYDLVLVQDSCLKLAHQHAGDNYTVGVCLSASSAFFRYGKDETYGFTPSLTNANKALEVLSTCSGRGAAFAKTVALRSKGLILREQGDQGRAADCHKEALELLRPLGGQRARLETVLHFAELSGTLDYMGNCDEGIQAGQQALDLARSLFVEGNKPAKHPATALALGALGFNLLSSGRAEEALDVHRQAYEMRSYVCGERHPETAMSIQQMGLCYQRLGMFAEAESCLKRSLEVRAHLPRKFAMINLLGNTQVQLANLYMAHGAKCAQKQSLAIRFLRLAIETRLEILEPSNRKVQEPLKDLFMLLSSIGQREEAERVDQWAKSLLVQASVQRTKSLQPELCAVQVSSRPVLGLQTAFREELFDAIEAGAQEAKKGLALSLQSLPGTPAPELVLGREAETQAALGLLQQGLGVMLVGDCGVGKSTLVRNVLRQLGTAAATVSLVSATSAEGVLLALCGSLGISVVVEAQGATRMLSESEAMERLLEKISVLAQSHDSVASPSAFVLEACEVPLAHAESRALIQRLMEKLHKSRLHAYLLLEARKGLGEAALPLPGVAELRVDPLDSASAQTLACAAYSPTGLPQPEEAQQICAASEGNPLKICLLASSSGSGKAELQDLLPLARSPSCFTGLLGRVLYEHLGDMVLLSWFGSTFTTAEAAALMGIIDLSSARLRLQGLQACRLVSKVQSDSWSVPSALREAAQHAASQSAADGARARHAALHALQLASFTDKQLAEWLPRRYVDVLSVLDAARRSRKSRAAFQGQLLSVKLQGLREILACVGLECSVLKVTPLLLGPPASHPAPPVDVPPQGQSSSSSWTALPSSSRANGAVPPQSNFDESLDAACCVACQARPKEWGALHGSSVHALLCGACYENPLYEMHKQTCSICRQSVDGFVRLYL